MHPRSATDLGVCRVCQTELVGPILDLGAQPVADALLDPATPPGTELSYDLRLAFCPACSLVQLARAEVPAGAAHGHGAAYSTTMTAHLDGWVGELLASGSLTADGLVVDVSSGSGPLLRRFAAAGPRTAGIEVDGALATAARADGIPTVVGRLGSETAGELVAEVGPADLVVVNHALAHVDDLADAIAGLALLTGPRGVIAIEFHHVLGLATENQFDIVCHAHRTYLSLGALRSALGRAGLELVSARRLAIHAGSVRATAARPERAGELRTATDRSSIAEIDALERDARLDRLDGYADLAPAASAACAALVREIDAAHRDGLAVAAYGAPTRAATLLNTAHISVDRLPYTVDRSPDKQGRCLPGSRVPILAPETIEARRPDRILVLPWTLRDEIVGQLAGARAWGARFIVPLPVLEVVE